MPSRCAPGPSAAYQPPCSASRSGPRSPSTACAASGAQPGSPARCPRLYTCAIRAVTQACTGRPRSGAPASSRRRPRRRVRKRRPKRSSKASWSAEPGPVVEPVDPSRARRLLHGPPLLRDGTVSSSHRRRPPRDERRTAAGACPSCHGRGSRPRTRRGARLARLGPRSGWGSESSGSESSVPGLVAGGPRAAAGGAAIGGLYSRSMIRASGRWASHRCSTGRCTSSRIIVG